MKSKKENKSQETINTTYNNNNNNHHLSSAYYMQRQCHAFYIISFNPTTSPECGCCQSHHFTEAETEAWLWWKPRREPAAQLRSVLCALSWERVSLHQGLANYDPWFKSDLPPPLLIKFIRTQLCSFICGSPMVAFVLQQRNWVVTTGTGWQKPILFTLWPFTASLPTFVQLKSFNSKECLLDCELHTASIGSPSPYFSS